MLEKDFYQLCENELSRLFDELEKLDVNSDFDIDYADGILKIVLVDGKTYVINRNSGNQKIWYSSPVSGADYFAFNAEKKAWENDENQELSAKLFDEIKKFL
jgi:iron donor protein CyaY